MTAKTELDVEAVLARITADIEARNWARLAADMALAEKVGVPGEKVRALFAQHKAKEEASFSAPKAQPPEEPNREFKRREGIGQPKAEPKAGLPAVILPHQSKAAEPRVSLDDAIAAMNERHAVIESVGGKTVITSREPSRIDPSKVHWVYGTKDSFLLRYLNRKTWVEGPGGRLSEVKLGDFWLSHRNRRQYRGVTFRPNGLEEEEGLLNLWQGWGCEPRAGDWSLIRRHVFDVIGNGNAEFAEYLIRWIAWSIQHPDRQAEVALVLIGAKGAGKGTLVRCLERIFGAHTFQVTSREEVIGKFNGHLEDCILFVADEAYWGGDKRCVGRLQGMITEPTLPIERKGIDLVLVPNYLHVVMLAEPGWVIPAGRYERRYAAISVSDKQRGDKVYFRALHHQIEDGGAEAMFYDLRSMDLEDWHPRDIPEALLTSEALRQQQGYTLPPLEQWLLTLLHDGALPYCLLKRPGTAFTRNLMEDARAKVPRLRELTDVALRDFLVEEVGCTKYREASANGWTFPPLAEARDAWSRKYGAVAWDYPGEDWRGRLTLPKPKPTPLEKPILEVVRPGFVRRI